MEKRRGSRHAERWYAVKLIGKLEPGLFYHARGAVKAISYANAEMELFERCKVWQPDIDWKPPTQARSVLLESEPLLIVQFHEGKTFPLPEH